MRKIAKLVRAFAFISAGISTISPSVVATCGPFGHPSDQPACPGRGGYPSPTGGSCFKTIDMAEADLARNCPIP